MCINTGTSVATALVLLSIYSIGEALSLGRWHFRSSSRGHRGVMLAAASSPPPAVIVRPTLFLHYLMS